MTQQFSFGSWLSRLPFDFKPKVCAGAAYGCTRTQRFGRQPDGIQLQGEWYCSADCFERGTLIRLKRLHGLNFRRNVSHRIPLGLLLLSQGTITQSQLSAALSAQRTTGKGRLGEWLQQTGAAGEYDVTRALSEQWSCPVLKSCSPNLEAASFLPLALLELHSMMPFHFAVSTRTIYVAFSESIAYPVLSAIENMLDCRTEACLITRSEMDRSLDEVRRYLPAREVVFERLQNDIEMAATVRSYALECSATAARISSCGEFIWLRLVGKQTLDVLFRSSAGEQSGRISNNQLTRPKGSQPI
jgi:hypothetical protein